MLKYHIRNIHLNAEVSDHIFSFEILKYQIINIFWNAEVSDQKYYLNCRSIRSEILKRERNTKYQIRNIERKKAKKKPPELTSSLCKLLFLLFHPLSNGCHLHLNDIVDSFNRKTLCCCKRWGVWALAYQNTFTFINIKATFSSATLILSVARRISSIAACAVQWQKQNRYCSFTGLKRFAAWLY